MQRVTLGNTGIEASRLGIGTGTEHPHGGTIQSRMGVRELAGVLVHAFNLGINLWDTAYQYGTYPHLQMALRDLRREDIVLVTKFATSSSAETERQMDESLKAVGTDYFDVCLIHGLRTADEFGRRTGAVNSLLKFREQGKIRSIGFSSHGLGALEQGLGMSEIELVWARINYAGLCMDASSLCMYDALAAVPIFKRVAGSLPPKIKSFIISGTKKHTVGENDRMETESLLREYHESGKGVVGMKVLAEGRISDKLRAYSYIKALEFVDAFAIGMTSLKEVDENCRLLGG